MPDNAVAQADAVFQHGQKEIIRLNLQVTNQQKSPVQPQYGTQKTSNETILGEDKNNVMLS